MRKQYIAPIVDVDSISLMIQVMNLTSTNVDHNSTTTGTGGDAPKRLSTMYI